MFEAPLTFGLVLLLEGFKAYYVHGATRLTYERAVRTFDDYYDDRRCCHSQNDKMRAMTILLNCAVRALSCCARLTNFHHISSGALRVWPREFEIRAFPFHAVIMS